MTVAIEREIKSLSSIPKRGHRIFSVNLKMVDVGEFWQVARGLGLEPELVHLRYRDQPPQIHALLWEGPLSDVPPNLEQQYDELSEQIDPDAIYFAAGRNQAEYELSL
jgi:ssDNA-specific exonuclease RecJ